MKIASVETWPVRLSRDLDAATGTAGTPTVLSAGRGVYRWSRVYPALYSTQFETALIRLRTDSGIEGWGEAQAPLVPEVACTIIDRLLGPMLLEETWEPEPDDIARLWWRMYETMRVRGQTGGFMIDAIAAMDIALWDIAGKAQQMPVAALLASSPKDTIPAYLSGLATGADPGPFRLVKRFFDTETEDEFLRNLPDGSAVDALWRLRPETAADFGRELDRMQSAWLEAPLPPEDAAEHARLAGEIRTPIALGESYRTRFEMAPFLAAKALRIFQPDLGRMGITEATYVSAKASEYGIEVVPHISIALGPQIAAALHFAAATSNCSLAEYNPQVLSIANRYLSAPIQVEKAAWIVPQGAGLGILPHDF